ncbi:helix-turn-helix domain-containing protein [Roseofilum reptotaenium CS-1145]|uniref:Transcriptional regulator n=1 Tax=Roseofilum reptotaenium AO1-A TaxID=1925591 RepID=A0A1L9QSW3_9CYAN|nr:MULTISPECIES: helix-turn-helix domain-containing protein [Roseofilum]OJJ25677.1 transcriptional regulator [Roseofilum reptotaenium AO1-A]MBP0012749.1 helix-turn-helix transcriptional regulator [Roseofilum sp. SID3]MBP0026277.1 helix-turn-helix transcriptional regulator [Roseofilum sp. SID2]MBP0037095.1 helix-turn-helix transcriptional regulator [Roseofilum sp. SID1]MBP0043509.1 helix-turn-helix transcriptional regulator [Roseofilum sp. SBFL]
MNYQRNPIETEVSIPESACFVPSCPIQFVLDLISSKWSVLILRELFQGDRRTHALLDALPGISSKTLTLRLRELEHHGLVKRTVYPEIPPHVEYSITEKGRELKPVLLSIKELGERWLETSCSCDRIRNG